MSDSRANFLVELGTAELPPTELKQIITDFKAGFVNELNNANIDFESIVDYATPRRIALLVRGISTIQAPQLITLRGPRYEVAFGNDGQVSPAAQGWLTSNNLTLDQTFKLEQGSQNFIAHSFEKAGVPFTQISNELVHKAVSQIKINKGMRWGNKEFIFIRPLLNYTLMLDDQLIPGNLFNIESSRTIFGHRFQSKISQFELANAGDYETELLKHFVIADFDVRQAKINSQAHELAATVKGNLKISQDLLDEITALTEWPKAYIAPFDKSFLEVPKEPLVITMEEDQRYFPLYTGQGSDESLLPYFIFVSNVEPTDPTLIITGNQRVVAPRLADAQFFYTQDLKIPLDSYQAQLHKIGFQAKLGTMQEKTDRLVAISQYLANKISPDDTQLVKDTTQAAQLAKCDLLTNLVREYPTTQGKSGYYYATAQGYNSQVANALYEQYLPRFSADLLPSHITGIILSLADKLDNLVGIFAIGMIPKGTKDPFALRRAAIGILRILDELNINLDLTETLKFVLGLIEDKTTNIEALSQLIDFIQTRQKGLYQDLGYSIEEINAVQALGLISPADFKLRIQAVQAYQNSEFFKALTQSNKRIRNLLAKADSVSDQFKAELAQSDSEEAMIANIHQQESIVASLLEQANYTAVLESLSSISGVVDAFFESNMINHENASIKANRYSIIKRLNQLVSQVADISQLKG